MRNWICATIVLFAAFFVLSPPPIFGDSGAGEPSVADGKSLFERALRDSYNGDYAKAEEGFREYIRFEPDDPAGYWRLAYVIYFRLRSEQKKDFPRIDGAAYDNFVKLADAGIEKAAARTEYDATGFYIYMEACLYSMKGGVDFGRNSWLRARSELKKTLELAKASKYQDAKYLRGLTNHRGADYLYIFLLARLPHDREDGLSLIFESAAQNANPYADDIWFTIFKIETDKKSRGRYTYEERTHLFDYLYSKYPRNEALKNYLKNRY